MSVILPFYGDIHTTVLSWNRCITSWLPLVRPRSTYCHVELFYVDFGLTILMSFVTTTILISADFVLLELVYEIVILSCAHFSVHLECAAIHVVGCIISATALVVVRLPSVHLTICIHTFMHVYRCMFLCWYMLFDHDIVLVRTTAVSPWLFH